MFKILIVILFLAVVGVLFRPLLPDEGPVRQEACRECTCMARWAGRWAHRAGGNRNCHRLTRAPRDRWLEDIDEYKQPNPNHIDEVPIPSNCLEREMLVW